MAQENISRKILAPLYITSEFPTVVSLNIFVHYKQIYLVARFSSEEKYKFDMILRM